MLVSGERARLPLTAEDPIITNILVPCTPNRGIVSDTSNMHQHDIGNYLGLPAPATTLKTPQIPSNRDHKAIRPSIEVHWGSRYVHICIHTLYVHNDICIYVHLYMCMYIYKHIYICCRITQYTYIYICTFIGELV